MKRETKAAQKAIFSAKVRLETMFSYLIIGLVDDSTYSTFLDGLVKAHEAVEASEVAVNVTEEIMFAATTVKSTRVAAVDMAEAKAAMATANEVLASAFTALRIFEWNYRGFLVRRLIELLLVASRR